MKQTTIISWGLIMKLLILVLFFLVSCQKKESDTNTSNVSMSRVPGGIVLKQEITFSNCSLEIPCDEGLTCATVDFKTGAQTVCINANTFCSTVASCSEGQCIAAESYPIQIHCAK